MLDGQQQPATGTTNMFTITHKLRTIVALGAALASSGVASAGTLVDQSGTAQPALVARPTLVADVKPAGSAGHAVGGLPVLKKLPGAVR
jgi:hypothetical protein